MDRSIKEHDAVVLLRDLSGEPFIAGDTGVVVYAYENADAFEVEFVNPKGKPRFIVITVSKNDLLKLQPRTRLSHAA